MSAKEEIIIFPQLNGKYSIKVYPIENKEKGYWNCIWIEILDSVSGEILGKYERNYPSLYDTFYPFEQNGKHYALYSKDYTATRVMSLPDCVDICGEESHSLGFCPTGYYVPAIEDDPDEYDENEYMKKMVFGKVGFVCGCIWGDDCSWKVQYLDLSKISEGKLIRDDRLGYIELPRDMKLKDAIKFWCFEEGFENVKITTEISLPINKKTDIDFSMLVWKYHNKKEEEK